MRRCTLALRYHECTILELQSFIKQRTGNTPPRGLPKSDYVRTLRELDNSSTFRFLALPPELSVSIYGFVIDHGIGEKPVNNRSCLLILCVNKLVYNEARDVLYGKHPLELSMCIHPRSFMFSTNKPYYARVEFGSRVLHEIRTKERTTVATLMDVWPQEMQNVKDIKFTFHMNAKKMQDPINPDNFAALHHILWSLAFFLGASSRIKTLGVRFVDCRRTRNDEMVLKLLEPLCRVKPQVKVTFEQNDTPSHGQGFEPCLLESLESQRKNLAEANVNADYRDLIRYITAPNLGSIRKLIAKAKSPSVDEILQLLSHTSDAGKALNNETCTLGLGARHFIHNLDALLELYKRWDIKVVVV